MLLKNISSRPHHLGDVLIAPLETKEVPNIFAGAYNKKDLVEVKAEEVKDVEAEESEEVKETPKKKYK